MEQSLTINNAPNVGHVYIHYDEPKPTTRAAGNFLVRLKFADNTGLYVKGNVRFINGSATVDFNTMINIP